MKTPVVFLIFLGIAFARGDPVPNKNNQLENKNGHQGTKPTALETASTRNRDIQIAHLQYQEANRMENVHNQDRQISQHSQLQNSQSHIQHQAAPFHSQNQASQVHGQDVAQQFHSQNQPQQFHGQNQPQQFHGQNQAQQFANQGQAQQFANQGQAQQFANQGQAQQSHSQGQAAAGSPVHPDQEMSNFLQSQQHMTPTAISMIQAQSKEQVHDFSAQQLYSASPRPQQDFYQDRRSMMDVQDQLGERRFGDSTGQQNQILSGVQSTEIRADGYPRVYLQRSAFDNREQPLVLPGVGQTHSTSVVVSGLKNLPSLPGLVYSAGAVPSAHAMAYSRPWFQGGAYVKQHWQTPYARYVYSHIL